MRLLDLTLHNVGPFDDARIEFLSNDEHEVPVTFITGENGTGKTIVLDAIRGLFGPQYCTLDRSLVRPKVEFRAEMNVCVNQATGLIWSTSQSEQSLGKYFFQLPDSELANLPGQVHATPQQCPRWIVDFWRSSQPSDSYVIKHFVAQEFTQFLRGSLSGIQRNARITELICYFDYLRSSDDAQERGNGEILFNTLREIFRVSLLEGGEFSHVARATFTPMVKQSGQLVPLANLSSGNAYLAQHLVNLLGKMHAVHVLRGTPPEDLCKTPGLLLIDEAENHLHPRWQQRFIRDVLHIFPNLQIIATTHSPFIVASVPGAKVFVCRYDRDRKTCVIDDESRNYENKPIEQILLSPAFGETQPFGQDVADLLEERKIAFEQGNESRVKEIEDELLRRNPTYFSYLEIEKKLAEIRGKKVA